ncbi:MAG: hypothetical protein KF757_07140 [Phycisphaeraceae bacterium]|nr:hypothetical protein [Phycisphaeraceae bacterium]MCW5763368.1 hypothetical protein [Phycisphaeraceae bacterium]
MSVQRTPGVMCQCQAGTPVGNGTLARVWSTRSGPAGEGSSALSAVNTIIRALETQALVSMSWDDIKNAAELARATEGARPALSIGVTLSQAVYAFAVQQVATQYFHVREQGANRGKDVEGILSSAGGSPGNSWCAAFAFHCHREAADLLCADTTCPRTTRAVFMIFDGRKAGNLTFPKKSVLDGSRTPMAGDVFAMVSNPVNVSMLNSGKTPTMLNGHAGLVVSYDASTQTLTTIEGNTDSGGIEDGDGVYLRTDRMASPKLWGFMRPRPVWLS